MPSSDSIAIREDNPHPEGTLIHEIQHAIQYREGFTLGSNTDMWDGTPEEKYEQYFFTAGEIEAREVRERLGMNEEQRRRVMPLSYAPAAYFAEDAPGNRAVDGSALSAEETLDSDSGSVVEYSQQKLSESGEKDNEPRTIGRGINNLSEGNRHQGRGNTGNFGDVSSWNSENESQAKHTILHEGMRDGSKGGSQGRMERFAQSPESQNEASRSKADGRRFLEAVERKDETTARRLLNEQAERKGFTPATVYRGQMKNAVDTAFQTQGAIWVSSTQAYAEKYSEEYVGTDLKANQLFTSPDSNVYDLYIKKGNVLDVGNIDRVISSVTDLHDFGESAGFSKEEILKCWNAGRVFESNEIWTMTITKEFADIARRHGYDTLSAVEDDNVQTYGVLYPENVKSAKTVTYDEDGKVIPLEKRFDTSKKDIRYSVSRKQRGAEETLDSGNGSVLEYNQQNLTESGEVNVSTDAETLGAGRTSGNNDSVWQQSDGSETAYRRMGGSAGDSRTSLERGRGLIDWSGRIQSYDLSSPREKKRAYGLLREISERRIGNTDAEGRTLPEDVRDYFSNTVLKNEKGELIPLFHATDGEFTVFEKGDFGFHVGSSEQAITRGGRFIKEVYVNLKNPLIIPEDRGIWPALVVADEALRQGIITRGDYNSISKMEGFHEKRYDSPANVSLRRLLKWKGYDGIVYINGHEGEGVSAMAFDPEQIKYVSNQAPTKNPDLRFSVSRKQRATEAIAKYKETGDVRDLPERAWAKGFRRDTENRSRYLANQMQDLEYQLEYADEESRASIEGAINTLRKKIEDAAKSAEETLDSGSGSVVEYSQQNLSESGEKHYESGTISGRTSDVSKGNRHQGRGNTGNFGDVSSWNSENESQAKHTILHEGMRDGSKGGSQGRMERFAQSPESQNEASRSKADGRRFLEAVERKDETTARRLLNEQGALIPLFHAIRKKADGNQCQ